MNQRSGTKWQAQKWWICHGTSSNLNKEEVLWTGKIIGTEDLGSEEIQRIRVRSGWAF